MHGSCLSSHLPKQIKLQLNLETFRSAPAQHGDAKMSKRAPSSTACRLARSRARHQGRSLQQHLCVSLPVYSGTLAEKPGMRPLLGHCHTRNTAGACVHVAVLAIGQAGPAPLVYSRWPSGVWQWKQVLMVFTLPSASTFLGCLRSRLLKEVLYVAETENVCSIES